MSLTAPLIDKHPDEAKRIGKLTARDFRRICKREGIRVDRVEGLVLGGFIYWASGQPFITIREYDPFVCFHELGHYFGYEDEERADLFAELCTGKSR